MKAYYLFIVLLFSSILSSQEFDEDFLNSLPANIRKDFEAQFESDLETENQFIPSPETRLDNLESALENAKSVLQKIEDEISRNNLKKGKFYKRFGEDYFTSFQTTFVPLNEATFNPNYVLDFGDMLSIQLIGAEGGESLSRVQRNGNIVIPNLAPINVAGLTLKQASEIISTKVSESLIGARAFVSLDQLRDVTVLIVGQASKPGMYTLSGASTILSLLSSAGGINENGSYRDIQLKRDKEIIETIDLYDVFSNGDLSFNAQLRSGDVILVNSKLNEVRVSGSFANEAIFEIRPDETLHDIFELADPLNLSNISSIEINRFEDGNTKKIELNLSDANNFRLIDGDTIYAYSVAPRFEDIREVFLEGEVLTPGKYFLAKDSTVLDVIKQAGGYTSNAYPFGGIYLSARAAELQRDSKDKSYDTLLRYLVSSPRFSSILPAAGNLVTILTLLRNYEPIGRIQTEFNLAKLEQDPSLNRILENGDKIIIPPLSKEIHVFGEVMNPGSFSYNPSFNPRDYIKSAGELSKVADAQRIIIVEPDGSTRTIGQNYLFFFGSDIDLYPGSTIYVPRQLGKLDGIDLASNVAPIISSVALSLASLNAINNN